MLFCEFEEIEDSHTHILIVEDSTTINNMLTKNLQMQNRTIKQAFSFEEAKKALLESNFEYIILDLNLPDHFGEDLVKDIKSLTQAKIVILTSEIDKQLREDLFKIGIVDYIVKQNDMSKVIRSIKQLFSTLLENQITKLLIVEDSIFMAKQYESFFTLRNYQVFIAKSAKEAKEILNNENIGVIVLDMELPDQHGLEFLDDLKADEIFCHIPVIVISGSDDAEVKRLALKNGASDYITKPFIIEEMLLKVDLQADANRNYIKMLCSEKFLKEYNQAIDDSTIVSKTDKNGIITFVNDAFCEISGYSKEELIGKSHNIIRHSDMPSSTFKEMWESILAKKVWRGVLKNRAKDGSSYFVQTTINPVVDTNGEIKEFIAIRTDITELERYKEILKKDLELSNNNVNYLKQYEEALNDFVLEIKTDPNGKILYVNDNFCKLSGYKKEELLEKDIKKNYKKQNSFKIASQISGAVKESLVYANYTKDGKLFHTDTKIYPIYDSKDNIEAYIYLMYDISAIIEAHREIETTQKEIIYKMGEIGESRSKETGNHVKRVAEYSRLLAKLYGLSDEESKILYIASPMHDIGKVAIADSILHKPGKLDANEWEIMKRHSEIGYEILRHSKRAILQAAAEITYTHHEKWDGSGYPRGLKKEEIPIFGRITAIADVFDALGSDRVYKKAWKLEKILEFFKEQKEKHFDPDLVDLFLTHIEKFVYIRQKYRDL